MEYKEYERVGVSEMRPYIEGEDLDGISVNDCCDVPEEGGMVARNPDNHSDQWYVTKEYFEENFREVEKDGS